MASPIGWALGVFAAFAVVAGFAGDRLARSTASTGTPARTEPAPKSVFGEPERPAGATGRTVLLHADRSGHYVTEASIDGRRVAVLVDTGASVVALTYEDAAAAGLRPFPSDYKVPMSTANGTIHAAPVRLREVQIGAIAVRDVPAVVMPAGRLGTSLLGMSFLRQLRNVEMANGRLTLRE